MLGLAHMLTGCAAAEAQVGAGSPAGHEGEQAPFWRDRFSRQALQLGPQICRSDERWLGVRHSSTWSFRREGQPKLACRQH